MKNEGRGRLMAEFDINVKEVTRVWHHVAPDWKRENFQKRHNHGLLFFLSGKIECDFGDFKVHIESGDIVKFPRNMPYSGRRLTDETVVCTVIDFETYGEDELEKLDIPIVYKVSDPEMFKKLFGNFLELWNKNSYDLTLLAKASLYRILGLIVSDMHGMKDTKKSRILEYINLNISNSELCCSSICRHFFISESTLRRDIVRATGHTPKEYILTQRINRAKNLLTFERNKKIKDISAECGFRSQYYFSLCFKKSTGLSPLEYRKENKATFSI